MRKTPTGRAVGRNMVWHNFFNDLRIVYAVYIFFVTFALFFLRIFIGLCEWIDSDFFSIMCSQERRRDIS